jgi:hypothetical protein
MGGYQTYFNGEFTLDEPLTLAQKNELDKFLREEHRDPSGCGKDPKMPAIFCDWDISEDGTTILCEEYAFGSEYDEWLEYIIKNYLEPWGRTLSGEADWDGDETIDSGTLTVKVNVVTSVSISEQIDASEKESRELLEGINKLLSLVPDQLPLLMGINDTMDALVKEHLKQELGEQVVAVKIKDLIALGATGNITKRS